MKLNKIMMAMPILGLSLSLQANTNDVRDFAPLKNEQIDVSAHAHANTVDSRAPQKSQQAEHVAHQLKLSKQILNVAASDALATCDTAAFVNASAQTVVSQITNQGPDCVNDLFSASAGQQVGIFTSEKMIAVAQSTKAAAQSYQGDGNADIEALILFLRAGFYAEFYNDGVTFSAEVTTQARAAIDAFVANSHFYDNSDAHGAVLGEFLIAMDSTELQDVYLPIVKTWLSKWDQNYAATRNMRRAVNNVFTLLYRGQWNSNYVNLAKNDAQLVDLLAQFTQKTWMVGSDAEYLAVNAAGELARLTKYSDGNIQTKVDAALNTLFSTYKSYGYGDALWLNAADVASYYSDCSKYNICNFDKTLESQVLTQMHDCSSTIKIRAQELTALQLQSACTTMEAEESRFHTSLTTNNQPVANDNNTFLQVNIFNSSADYQKYAKAIFKIDTNNGGMYLEGDPSKVGNQANFIAYEASYAKPDHYVWNLEHEYVHYLDGRFDMYGDFNAPTEDVVWWSEGVAEYIANQNDNQAAIDTVKDGSVYSLGEVFATTYDGFDQDRIYRWGYLAVRFMFERHFSEVESMLSKTRVGDWAGYKAKTNSWATSYANEFTQWTQDLAAGSSNQAPNAQINGPYEATAGQVIAFSSNGSNDPDGQITSYLWDFGDGTQSNEANPSHTFVGEGTYNVKLTVTDNQGLSSQVTTTAKVLASNTGTVLNKGVAVTVNGSQDEEKRFTFSVPSGATDLSFVISGGTGDADLYVKFDSAPSTTSFDCRPYVGGNSERCDVASPTAGTYHAMLRGYNAFSSVSLVANYTSPASNLPDACATQGPVTGGRLSAGVATCLGNTAPIWLSLENVSGQQSISIETANGSGDLGLEYSNAGWPTESNVEASSFRTGNGECINLSNQSQYWGYLKVTGNAQGATILVKYNDGWCN
ncbi:collagenase [Pseudoalteromonas xiamenensis]|uniref:collagenase n=1 Tax=Pseudoalteromonas xiamenensis TaxID=882626 RepID=UPI0027E59462|nr:collagenase [Pseudoalteromonas xiamenensis]WMN59883.1 collagenase [Pseudoalteromonas xiamenensis]